MTGLKLWVEVGDMRVKVSSLVALMVLAGSSALAAEMNYDVRVRKAILEDGRLRHEATRQPMGFRMEVVDDSESAKAESWKQGRPFVTAHPQERYSVRLYNPLPVRVAVNLTVDGLNSISGKPSGISDGQKWLIEPYGTVLIPGWQVTGGEARRFFFTDKPKSYAEWRGEALGRDLAANCGVIGAAYFWNQGELDRYYDDHPRVIYRQRPYPCVNGEAKASNRAAGAPAQASMDSNRMEESEQQAGTGMGERQDHPTYEVDFKFDTGMYRLSQALVLYYDFAKSQTPNPFPALSYAPEMN
jgi:hypothetical protein